jgi:hypothetical protein
MVCVLLWFIAPIPWGRFLFQRQLQGLGVANPIKLIELFGEYKGTVKANGFFWVNPFMTKNLPSPNEAFDPILSI